MHMPSHVYIRTGHYHKGTLANQRAVIVDSAYTTVCHAQGAYPLAYYPHNYHFMSATATLAGNSKVAIDAAKATSELAHPQLMKEQGWGTLQHYYSIPYFILVKFGKWQQILNMPEETVELTYPRAVRHYARGMAFAASNDTEKARFELKQLKELSTDESISEITIWDINPATSIIEIAIKVLDGEIAMAEENYDQAVENLRNAVAIEDNLNYDEPPDWFLSVRHHLGEALIRAGKADEARRVYERDLEVFPENGWALHGLMISHRDLGNEEEMNSYNERFFRAWEHADIGLSVSKAL
jgi:tetratricopeptide (TPR) repeat protein